MALFDESDGDLITYWKTKSSITDLVGTGTGAKIWPDAARQKATPPLIYFTVSGGDLFQRLAATDSGGISHCHTFCFGRTPSEANQLAQAVIDETVDFKGAMGATTILAVRCLDKPDGGYESLENGSDGKYWWRRVILRITH